MLLCACKHCGHVFAVTKVKPFCSGICRRYNKEVKTPEVQDPSPAILVGAQTNETKHHSNR